MPGSVQIRVTGILLEGKEMLIVKQRVSAARAWSLPGGRLEEGETLEAAVVRELLEETGLETKVIRLLYVCEVPSASPALIHMTFLLERIGGTIVLPSNEFDRNPISDVKMVPVGELPKYGFTEAFMNRVLDGFPEAGSYMGAKANIGL